MRCCPRWAALLLRIVLPLCACAGPAQAHKGSDAYLDVQQFQAAGAALPASGAAPATRELRFTLAVAIKDLDLLVPMDANSDGKVTWGEARAAMPLVTALANAVANLEPPAAPSAGALVGAAPGGVASSAGLCHLDWQPDGLDRRGDGTYVRLAAKAVCPTAQPLVLRYTMLRAQDANHRLLIAGRVDGRDLLTTYSPQRNDGLVLAGAASTAAGQAAAGASSAPSTSGWSALRVYFELGVQHLLRGYDHLAFLLALVLPLQLVLFAPKLGGTAGRSIVPATSQPRNAVWWALLRTVTAFTAGHSITLMLATFGWTQVSPRWVEPAIALTIVVTALLNLRPLPWVRTDVLALLFGMVHGIGFAGLLQEAAAPSGLLPWALAGFNLGVEAGQLIVVGAWVLLCQPAMGRSWYASVVVRGGSVLLALLAAFWFWQRVH